MGVVNVATEIMENPVLLTKKNLLRMIVGFVQLFYLESHPNISLLYRLLQVQFYWNWVHLTQIRKRYSLQKESMIIGLVALPSWFKDLSFNSGSAFAVPQIFKPIRLFKDLCKLILSIPHNLSLT